jgi:hypothetical protein
METITGIREDQEPIDYLAPNTAQHARVLQYIKDRIEYSEEKMSVFYSRWRLNELALQAYISLPDYDKLLQARTSAKGLAAAPVAINVPFAWSTVMTIVTYLIHMFGGRSPIFQVGSMRAEQVQAARNMELLLQYNADYKKLIKALYIFLLDGETYGMAAVRTMWAQEKKKRWALVQPDPNVASLLNSMGQPATPTREQQEYISFEGNTIENIDPFMFFPDPRVPMTEVAEKGEFVFWRAFEGKHQLLKAQAQGLLKYVDTVTPYDRDQNAWADNASSRGIRALGEGHAGRNDVSGTKDIKPNFQIDQGSIEIIPYDLGLGSSRVPEKWLFTLCNKRQIIQAQKLDLPSDKHPVEVAEPASVGYAFGSLGTVDMLTPMQDLMSWFINSHVYNVRASLNNMFVVDPARVEMGDLLSPEPGKIIRLKNTMMPNFNNQRPIEQLQVSDVTRSHIGDFSLFSRLASDLTGATDNNRGLQADGGRKTATEVRVAADAGTSRLAAKGKLYSAQALTGLASQWALNYQANLTQDFELSVLGQNGLAHTVRLNPETVSGDFYYPIHDGTLPLDKAGMFDIWQQLMLGVAQDPGNPAAGIPPLRSSFDMVSMFTWVAQLGGAQNIESFKINQVPTGDAMNAIGSGQGISIQDAMAAMGGGIG